MKKLDLKIVKKFNSIFFSYLTLVLLSLLFIPFSDVTQPSPEFALFGTLFEGNFLNLYSDQWPYFDPRIEGRFQPLVGIHLNLILLYESFPSIFDVYFIQSLLSIFFIVSLIYFLKSLNLNINPFYLSIFVIMPSYVFSFYHPFLVESYSLLSLVFFFHILFLILSKNSIKNFLLFIFLLINLLITKISFFSILTIFSLSYLFCMLCIQREFHIRKFMILILVIFTSISFFIFNLKFSGKPADQISLSLKYFHLFLKTDILLFLFSIITINFFIMIVKRKYEFNHTTFFILCLSLTSTFYFFLLMLYGKYDGYQQVVSYFLFVPLIVLAFKKDRLLQNLIIKYTLLIFVIYFIYYQRQNLAITVVISILFYFYLFIYKNYFLINSYNILKMTIIVLSIWSLLIPGIYIHLDHKFNSLSINILTKKIKDFSINNNEIYIQHVSYTNNCHGSIMHDFQFAERLKYYIKDTNFFFLPMPKYEIFNCIDAYSKIEKDYTDLNEDIFQYYKKKFKNYPDFIFLKHSDDFHSFFNKNFHYNLNYYSEIKFDKQIKIWKQLSYLARYISSYQPSNPNYIMLKLKTNSF
jgi:hypothetical protein